MLTTTIYALCDPDTGEIRYIGKSDNPASRLLRHIGPQELRASTHKAHWIQRLLDDGKKPIMQVLEHVPIDQWQEAEKWWIQHLKNQGANLTNICDGGHGRTAGLKHSSEVVDKIRKALTGHPVSPQTRQKIKDKLTGKSLSEKHRESLRLAGKQRWENTPEETRKELVENLRHPWSDESKTKLSATNTNKKRGANSSSPYLGVTRFKRDGNWRAYINHNGKQHHLGYYDSEESAARAYDKAAREMRGANVPTNFRDEEATT